MWIFGAIVLAKGTARGLVLSVCNLRGMQFLLAEIEPARLTPS
jgi:hypothetical protein